MTARVHQSAGRAFIAGLKRFPSPFAQERLCQLPGEETLADTCWPGEQVGMREPSAPHDLIERSN